MPSEQEQLWLDVVIETGDPKKAVLIAYPNCGKQAANPEEVIRSRASQLKSKLKAEFVARLQERLIYEAPALVSNLMNLAYKSSSDSVRVVAARDLLDRAAIGIKADSASLGVSVVINRDGVGVQVNVNNPDDSTDNDDDPITGEGVRVADPQ